MKSKSFLIILFTLFLSTGLFAQPNHPQQMEQQAPPPKFEPGKMLMHLKSALELNENQLKSIKSILFETEKHLVDLRQEEFEERLNRMKQHEAIMERTHKEISKVLTKEQAETFEKMREDMKLKHHRMDGCDSEMKQHKRMMPGE